MRLLSIYLRNFYLYILNFAPGWDKIRRQSAAFLHWAALIALCMGLLPLPATAIANQAKSSAQVIAVAENKRMHLEQEAITEQDGEGTQIFLPLISSNGNTQAPPPTQPETETPPLTGNAPLQVDKEFILTLQETERLLTQIHAKLTTGQAVEAEIVALAQIEEKLSILDAALQQQYQQREAKLRNAAMPAEILQRHAETVANHVREMAQLTATLKRIQTSDLQAASQSDLAEVLEQAIAQLQQGRQPEHAAPVSPVTKLPDILPSQLPETSQEAVIAANADLLSAVPPGIPNAGDLTATIDVQLTREITELAASLNHSPLKIYQWVKDNIDFEAYPGSRRGSRDTFHVRSGNDFDQASLLIALLRASNIPARYVAGKVKMPAEQANNWLGVENLTAGYNLLGLGGLGPSISSCAADGQSLCFNHTWVAAYLPYTNYRGLGSDNSGKMWVALDPSVKAYTHTQAVDIPAAMGFNAASFIDSYLTISQTMSPVERYIDGIYNYTTLNRPDLTFPDNVFRMKKIVPDALEILPASLPYTVVSKDADFQEIPASRRFSIRFQLYQQVSTTQTVTLIDYTAPLPALSSRRTTLAYEPATIDDSAVISLYGSLYLTPPDLIYLVPVLRVNGVAVAQGPRVRPGENHWLRTYYLGTVNDLPTSPYTESPAVAGDYLGIALDPFSVSLGIFIKKEAEVEAGKDAIVGEKLYRTAIHYLDRVNKAWSLTSDTMQVVNTTSVAQAIVSNKLLVWFNAFTGVPVIWEWKGLEIDAQHKVVGGAVSIQDGSSEKVQFMTLLGAEGSASEHRVFEEVYEEQALSAVKVLQIAHAQGVPICTIVSSIANECPGMAQSSLLTAGITFALWQGLEVLVPQSPITVVDWQGGAYIARDPVTKEGYLFVIEAGLNGGSTIADVWAGNNWATILFKGCTLPGSTLMVSPKQVTSPPPDSYWPEQKGYIPRWFASAWRVFMFLPGDASLRPAITIEYDVCQASDPLNPLHIKEVLYPHFAPEPGDYRIATDWNFLTQMDLAVSNYLTYTIYGVEVETPDGLYAPINGDAITLTANVIPRMPPGGAVQWAVDEWYGEGSGTFGTPMTTSTTFSGSVPGFLNVIATVSNENGSVSDDQRLYAFGVEMVDVSSEYMTKGYSAYPLIGDPTPVTYTYRVVPDDFPLVVSPAYKELYAIVSQQITTVLTHTFDLVNNELLAGPNLWAWDGKDNNGLYVDSNAYQTRFQLTSPNHKRAFSQPRNVNVVEVTKVEFLNSTGNLITDPNNHPDFPGGVRVFPDKPTPGEERKNQIKVRATLNTSVTVGTLGVAFKSFDLDDPGGLIDANHSLTVTTPTLPAEGLLNPAIGLTDGDNTVEVTFTVTMQPGDNFKVLASTNSAMLAALSTDVITATTDSSGATTLAELQPLASARLTIWRKLHVEVDSMGPLPSGVNEVTGNILSFDSTSGRVNVDTVLRDGSHDLDTSAPDTANGRFENGTITTTASGIGYSVVGNGETHLIVTGGIQIPYTLQNLTGTTASGNVLSMNVFTTSTTSMMLTLDHTITPGDFNNGSITLEGATYDILQNLTDSIEITGTIQISFTLQDDDVIVDPREPDVSHLLGADNRFAPAYVEPEILYDNPNSPFVLNVPVSNLIEGYEWNHQSDESDDYWAIYLRGGYQFDSSSDADPYLENAVLGVADALVDGLGATIFLEAYREYPTSAIPDYGEYSTVVHELGHIFGGEHTENGVMCSFDRHNHGLCTKTTEFDGSTLKKIREINHP